MIGFWLDGDNFGRYKVFFLGGRGNNMGWDGIFGGVWETRLGQV